MRIILTFILILNISIMNAQEEDFFGNKMIQLSDKLFICDEKIYKKLQKGRTIVLGDYI